MSRDLAQRAVGTLRPAVTFKRGHLLPIALILATCATLAIDIHVARFVATGCLSDRVVPVLDRFEAFAHGSGVAAIVLAIWLLDTRHRRRAMRILSCAFGSGILAMMMKLLIARTRPFEAEFNDGVLSTFGPVLPYLHGISLDASVQSFPSGHTATAVGLAMGLNWQYPRGRWLFAMLAILAASQRIAINAHFVSDTMGGAALASAVAVVLLGHGPVAQWFQCWEQRSIAGD